MLHISKHKISFSKGLSKLSRIINIFFTDRLQIHAENLGGNTCIFNYEKGCETVFTLQWKLFLWNYRTVFINKLSLWKPFFSCWTAKIFTTRLWSLLHFSEKELEHWVRAEMKRLSLTCHRFFNLCQSVHCIHLWRKARDVPVNHSWPLVKKNVHPGNKYQT